MYFVLNILLGWPGECMMASDLWQGKFFFGPHTQKFQRGKIVIQFVICIVETKIVVLRTCGQFQNVTCLWGQHRYGPTKNGQNRGRTHIKGLKLAYKGQIISSILFLHTYILRHIFAYYSCLPTGQCAMFLKIVSGYFCYICISTYVFHVHLHHTHKNCFGTYLGSF